LTAQRFVPDPFGGVGARLYRTGDVCRFSAEGVLEFVGRRDAQVKVRGFRVELGEVEAALAGCAGVREAVVDVRLRGSEPVLTGWVVGVDGELDGAAVRMEVAGVLPAYAVPSVVVGVSAIPLGPTGKLDRAALPDPTALTSKPDSPRPSSRQPRGRWEELVADIWAEVLAMAAPPVDTTFFDLGGSSLGVAEVYDRLHARYLAALSLVELFSATTIRQTAALLAARCGADAGPAELDFTV